MDDIFQILGLIAAFIIFIVSAIRKDRSSAKKTANDDIDSVSYSTDDLSAEIEDEFVKYRHEQDLLEIKKSKLTNKEGIGTISNNSQKEPPEEIIEPEFNLRDAVIYSEILNRKKF